MTTTPGLLQAFAMLDRIKLPRAKFGENGYRNAIIEARMGIERLLDMPYELAKEQAAKLPSDLRRDAKNVAAWIDAGMPEEVNP